MMKTRLVAIALGLISMSSAATAGVIASGTWSGNGNTYEIVVGEASITWGEAKIAAEGSGGHLATITSTAENDFIAALVNGSGLINPEVVWLGGYQIPDSAEPLGGWAWVTGEAWWDDNGNAWAPGEPNNGAGGTQHYLHYWPTAGLFDDMENRNIMVGYVAEYSKVSEPGTLALLGIGLLLLGVGRRMAA